MDDNKTPIDEKEENTVSSEEQKIFPATNISESSETDVTPSENELYSEESEQQNVSDDLIPKCESTPTDEPQMGFGYYAHNPSAVEKEIKKKNWLFEKDADVPKNYNPYREDRSVFKEVFEETPAAFAGNAPLPDESRETYMARIYREWIFAKKKAAAKLKSNSTIISLAIILYLVLSNAVVIALSGLVYVNNDALDLLNNIAMVFQYAFMFPVVLYIINVGKKHKCKTFFHKSEVSKFYIFKWSIISLGVTYLVAFVFDIFFSIIESMGVYVNDLTSELPTDATGLVIYFLAVVICAPIFEELLFRGPILAINLKFGGMFASIVSGLLFGLIHQNHQQMFYAMVLGFIFSFIDIKAGSITPSIIAHMAVNGYSFINVFFLSFTNYNEIIGNPDAKLEGPQFALLLSGIMNTMVYLFIITAIILLIFEFIHNREHFFLSKGDNLLTEGEKNKIFFSTPTAIIMLVLLFLTIAVNSFVNVEAIMSMLEM